MGPLQVRQSGVPVAIPGAKPRAILTMLGLHHGSVLPADTVAKLLWGEHPPRTAAKAMQTHISSLRRTLGDGMVLTEGLGWTLAGAEVDAARYKLAAKMGRDAAAAGDTAQALVRFDEALVRWRGVPELPDSQQGVAEKTRWIEGHAALVEDRADVLLASGRAAEIIGELGAAVAEAPLRERRWGQLMLALYRAGRQGEALGAYQRARSLLADELGVDPGPELRRLEAAIVAQDPALDIPVVQQLSSVMRAVTFLLTDIEGSTAAWEADADAMAVALARHDELVEQVVTSRGGRLIKTRGEGDATFSVFERPSPAAAAAIELQDAIAHEPWALSEPMRIRVALHTGEVEFRDGDYFGRAVNRAARLRSLAAGGQILCSGATAELVIDSLRDDVLLVDLGMRQLRNLPRPEHVFELRLETADDNRQAGEADAALQRPGLPAVLSGPGPFVGRAPELARLMSTWQTALTNGTHAVLIAGEPGVGKTRLAGEWSRQAYEQGAVVLYGRCDEDLGAPYQPFAEALRSLVPCFDAATLRGLRGVEALLPLVPGLADVLPDLAAPTRADPDTERYALFDAVVALLGVASGLAPVVLVLDDLHWAAKPTLLLLRHLLRFGEQARVQVVGTYRSTDLDRSHPLAAMLADLHRDGVAHRLQLSGLDENDVTTYVAEAGYDDEELARALASVTGGNPFFLIEALRHVEESGGRWDPNTLPQGVREAVSRRLSRLPAETNKALAAAAVVGSRFALDLVEQVVGQDLVDAFDEACKAGIVIEEPGGRYRFNHAIVRQSLLAELASVRRMRLHQRIATTLEARPGADDELLAELAHHYYECAWAGNAVKAVDYCRRAADQAMARLAYEGAADLYNRAVHALEEIDDELPDRDDQAAQLLIARCEALLAAGDVTLAAGAVAQLQQTTFGSERLAAWATCFDGQLSMLVNPERLDDIEAAVRAAAERLTELDDAAGEAKAHTVRAACLARLGRIGDCEVALDAALAAARRAGEHRQVNAVLAGAPLAALWGPNPVPRAGGRCLDVVRLLRITTDSPAVEATSTRCQAVLEAFRGRAAAARRMIESARRTVTELGLRHALCEVEQFAGIVELVVEDPGAAEAHLRKAYNGFRRMGLESDTAETAALLGRACLALGRDAEADELCSESELLAGHALKASIAWRTLRAQLLGRADDYDEARRVAENAVTLAERTDLLVDHADACLTLAQVLGASGTGDAAKARAVAERAVALYERKGAGALAEIARRVLGEHPQPAPPPRAETPGVEPDNACVRAIRRLDAAYDREAWEEIEQLVAAVVSCESHRKVVGASRVDLPYGEWERDARRYREMLAPVRYRHVVVAVRGEHLALTRLEVGPDDRSPGAPRDEFLQLYGLDQDGRLALQDWFDIEDLGAAMAELESLHTRLAQQGPRKPATLACQAFERLKANFSARDWDAMAELLADNAFHHDRRSVVGAELKVGRDAVIAEMSALAEIGVKRIASDTIIATRGTQLILSRSHAAGHDPRPDAFRTDVLNVLHVDAEGRIDALVTFDLDDFEAAMVELESRYLAGEAAQYARTWQAITDSYAAFRRGELPAFTPSAINVDHRRAAGFAPGDLIAYIRAGHDLDQDMQPYVEAVHRLNEFGAVTAATAYGTSHDGFTAEWRSVIVSTIEGELISRTELFEAEELDAALAKFEQLHPHTRRVENAAGLVAERLWSCFTTRDWDGAAEVLADDVSVDDRRPIVNAGLRRGRDAEIKDLQAAAKVGIASLTPTVVATRGRRLALSRTQAKGRGPEAIRVEVLHLIEIDHDERIVGIVVFEVEQFEAAIAELEARYLTGEAAAYAKTWSVIAETFVALGRGEIPKMTPDCTTEDHRRGPSFAPGELTAYLEAGLNLDQTLRAYALVVHRLTDLGAVCSYVAHGLTPEGFDGEWQQVGLVTVADDLVNRCELFDEGDIDAALAKFDQLSTPPRRLDNAASRLVERFQASFAARDWDAMAAMLAEDVFTEDRRGVVNVGILRGRDAVLADLQAVVDVMDVTYMTTVAIATRGDHLVLTRARLGSNERPEAVVFEVLHVIDIDADGRLAAVVTFDLDHTDGAFAELDARYLAGEAAAHAQVWSLVAECYTGVNRRELPALAQDFVSVDHRLLTSFETNGVVEYARSSWEQMPNIHFHVESVHRLSEFAALVTHKVTGTSRDGFDAEWRELHLMTVQGDRFNRSEVFDETNIASAIERFDELFPQPHRLENAAIRVYERLRACVASRDWSAMTTMLARDISTEDRRRVVNSGLRQGRDAALAEISAMVDIGVEYVTSQPIATRGERLVLNRSQSWGRDRRPEAFHTDLLEIIEINADDLIVGRVVFDLEDVDAAFAELEARYLDGEAATHAHIWSLVSDSHERLNRQLLPLMTPDVMSIDHRRVPAFPPGGDFAAYIRVTWEQVPNITFRIAAVHRLSSTGAVLTLVASGTSQEGFAAEWRMLEVLTAKGDRFDRCEVFAETDIEAALARFDELQPRARTLENAASRLYERYWASFAARDWSAVSAMLADDVSTHDRRPVVNAGVRRGREAEVTNLQAIAEVTDSDGITCEAIAIRGQRLALCRLCFPAYQYDLLVVVEIDADERITAGLGFNCDDIDAAFDELDARYLAGEAAPYAQTWQLVVDGRRALNRHEAPWPWDDMQAVDHRRVSFGVTNFQRIVSELWPLVPDARYRVVAVHAIEAQRIVLTAVIEGTDVHGNELQWSRSLLIDFTPGGMRTEVYEDDEVDKALARLDELRTQGRRLENAASRADERTHAHFAARDWAQLAEMMSDDYCSDDRRPMVNSGVRHGPDDAIDNMRESADLGIIFGASRPIAIRGDRLVLTRTQWSWLHQPVEEYRTDVLSIVEINPDERMTARVWFDIDDVDAAFEEIDARYLAGEAAAHARTWSVIAETYSAYNRGEFPRLDWVNVDRRRGTPFGPKDISEIIRVSRDLTPDLTIRIEAVHRLDSYGAVITATAYGTSREGFRVEYRMIQVMRVEAGRITHCELFDEDDIGVAIARFEELRLQPPARRLENTASQVKQRYWNCYTARAWDEMVKLLADDVCVDDRRRVVNAGVQHGRELAIANTRASADLGADIAITVIATRGERLALSRVSSTNRDLEHGEFGSDMLNVLEVDGENRISAAFLFDPDDVDTAFEMLDRRYLAGEASAHSHAWSVIRDAYSALNRQEIPLTTTDMVSVDHRRGIAFAPGDLLAYFNATWNVTPQTSICIERVCRLSKLGGVVVHSYCGTTIEGFDAEWRDVTLLTIDGDKLNRCEVYDEESIDGAIARFDELHTNATNATT
ncbi:BTAD domain-containing putative transcriptional regulator [Mycobacterium intermedium]